MNRTHTVLRNCFSLCLGDEAIRLKVGCICLIDGQRCISTGQRVGSLFITVESLAERIEFILTRHRLLHIGFTMTLRIFGHLNATFGKSCSFALNNVCALRCRPGRVFLHLLRTEIITFQRTHLLSRTSRRENLARLSFGSAGGLTNFVNVGFLLAHIVQILGKVLSLRFAYAACDPTFRVIGIMQCVSAALALVAFSSCGIFGTRMQTTQRTA